MQKIDSTAISFLRFPLMVGVVCMHTDIRVYCPWLLDYATLYSKNNQCSHRRTFLP